MGEDETVRERGQSKYQVRFGWGAAGAARIARDAHLLVWVDVIETSAMRTSRLPDGPEVVHVGLAGASDVADRVTGLQAELGDRCVVAVVAAGIDDAAIGGDAAAQAGEPGDDDASAPDFAVEDLLAAGAVIDALAERGIDHSSPEAASACASYTGLRRAVRHLVSASVSAGMLRAAGREARVEQALTGGGMRTIREHIRGA